MGRKRIKPPARFWSIVIYDGTQELGTFRIPSNEISEDSLQSVLQVLVAKHGQLTDDEIASSFKHKRVRAHHLDVRRSNRPSVTFECGQSVHAVAVITDEHGDRIPSLRL